jgi:transposase
MLDALHIFLLQDQATAHWHDNSAPLQAARDAFENLILEQHRANFDLWHREDAARDPLAADQAIAAVKRAIDKLNQRRNDLVERIDVTLLEIAPPQPAELPLNSETPGLMIDRLSILALKLFHTEEETRRKEASAEHHQRNRERLTLLIEQRNDLAGCLATLWTEVMSGKRRFKLYRQLKMYNDPALNPVLYNKPLTPDG